MRRMHTLRALGVAAVLAIVLTPATAPVEATVRETSPAASPNVVTEWHQIAQQAVAANGEFANVNALYFAMVQGAVYDAVNAITRTHEPYLVAPRARPWYSQEAAAATAAYRVLVDLFPAQQPTLAQRYDQSLAAIRGGPAEQGGIEVGNRAADAMLAAREGDGRHGDLAWVIGTAPGQWRPTPPAFLVDTSAWTANVTPFLVPDAAALRSPGPNPLTSAAYASELQEVQSVGSATSTTRTADQTEAAIFWHDRDIVWYPILDQLAVNHRLDMGDTARMLAMVRLAEADAAIACFNDKYHWSSWRPVTAIRAAADDGNPATEPDPEWLPLLFTPPFPEHSSGHACASGAFAATLRTFFGTDRVTFSAHSDDSGTTRTFQSFSQALDEVIDARVWGGIHFRTADEQGADIGRAVAAWERTHYFRTRR